MHNGYPLAPEKLKNMLSIYCSDIVNNYEIKIGNVNKLVSNFGNEN